ncbi:MAG: hypothetical protein ACJAZN_003257, partial [Planctomycetota bacterium]
PQREPVGLVRPGARLALAAPPARRPVRQHARPARTPARAPSSSEDGPETLCAVSAIGGFGIHCLGSSLDRYLRARYRLLDTDCLPSARSARRVDGVVTGADQIDTDFSIPTACRRRVALDAWTVAWPETSRTALPAGRTQDGSAQVSAHASSASRRRQQVGAGKSVPARSVPVTTATKAVNAEPLDR